MSTEVEQLWLSLSTLQVAFDSAVRELRAVAIAAKETAEERDAARLELRALEWLALHGYPVGRDPDGGRVMAVYREADLEPDWHPSWASAARALGWEG